MWGSVMCDEALIDLPKAKVVVEIVVRIRLLLLRWQDASPSLRLELKNIALASLHIDSASSTAKYIG